jgi:hypothetical protein
MLCLYVCASFVVLLSCLFASRHAMSQPQSARHSVLNNPDLLLAVACHLSGLAVARLAQVCKSWHVQVSTVTTANARGAALWRRLAARDFLGDSTDPAQALLSLASPPSAETKTSQSSAPSASTASSAASASSSSSSSAAASTSVPAVLAVGGWAGVYADLYSSHVLWDARAGSFGMRVVDGARRTAETHPNAEHVCSGWNTQRADRVLPRGGRFYWYAPVWSRFVPLLNKL